MPSNNRLTPDLLFSVEPDLPPPQKALAAPVQPDVPPPVTGKIAGSEPERAKLSLAHQLFDINTDEFFSKILQALNPLNRSSVAVTQNDDDPTELYGFIWINATIVFCMFVSATGSNLLADWLHKSTEDTRYEYDFHLLTKSISLFYGYALGMPAVLYGVTTWFMAFEERLSFTRLVSIYSYSALFWVPATAANIILAVFVSSEKHRLLLTILLWALVAVSAALTSISILVKMRPIILRNLAVDQKRQRAVLAGVLLSNVAFAVAVNVLFFHII